MAKKTEELNVKDEVEEHHRENENGRRYADKELETKAALDCDWPGCNFQAMNRSGLVNYQRQSHNTPQFIPCP